jgi:hypothetical protein
VHLAAGLDHLRLAPLAQAALTEEDARALGELVSSHFATDDLTVAAFVEGAWLLRFARSIDCSTQPPDAVVGHNVHDFMPAGRDGARIRSLMNEIQMLLHEHPVNQRRERARRLPVNGWWLWGFGDRTSDASSPGIDRWRMHSDDRWLRALGHAQGSAAGDITTFGSDTLRGDTFVALSQPPAQRVEDSLASVDAGLLSMLASNVWARAVAVSLTSRSDVAPPNRSDIVRHPRIERGRRESAMRQRGYHLPPRHRAPQNTRPSRQRRVLPPQARRSPPTCGSQSRASLWWQYPKY